jgi:hypothetical protein
LKERTQKEYLPSWRVPPAFARVTLLAVRTQLPLLSQPHGVTCAILALLQDFLRCHGA